MSPGSFPVDVRCSVPACQSIASMNDYAASAAACHSVFLSFLVTFCFFFLVSTFGSSDTLDIEFDPVLAFVLPPSVLFLSSPILYEPRSEGIEALYVTQVICCSIKNKGELPSHGNRFSSFSILFWVPFLLWHLCWLSLLCCQIWLLFCHLPPTASPQLF